MDQWYSTPMERRALTEEDIIKLEAARTLEMKSPFEKAFLDNFQSRFALYGMKTVIHPKQVGILEGLYRRYLAALKHGVPAVDQKLTGLSGARTEVVGEGHTVDATTSGKLAGQLTRGVRRRGAQKGKKQQDEGSTHRA